MLLVACNVSGWLIRVKTCCHFCPLLVAPRALLPLAPMAGTVIVIIARSLCAMCGSRDFHASGCLPRGIAKYLLLRYYWRNKKPFGKSPLCFSFPCIWPISISSSYRGFVICPKKQYTGVIRDEQGL